MTQEQRERQQEIAREAIRLVLHAMPPAGSYQMSSAGPCRFCAP